MIYFQENKDYTDEKILVLTVALLLSTSALAQTYKSDQYIWNLGSSIAKNIIRNQKAANNGTSSYTNQTPSYNQPETFYYKPYKYTVQPKQPTPTPQYMPPSLPTAKNLRSALPKYPQY